MLSAAPEDERSIFEVLRRREFARLDASGLAYLDYAGSALYGVSQVRAHGRLLESHVYGNPHSDHAPSRASTDRLEDARARLLAFLDVDASTHEVCFTANATAAIKLVAESYPFGPRACFVASSDNHNSINGVREYAHRAGARVRYVPLDAELRLRDPTPVLDDEARRGGGLFAFPAQSNFSGVRHPLSLVEEAKARGFDTLVDVAAYLPSEPLSLRRWPIDFAALSFYKLFGYPTGLGALVARRDALRALARPWFAGGTIHYATVASSARRLREGHLGFEDGTPSFLAAAALPAGFDLLAEVGMGPLATHVRGLTTSLLASLTAARHASGAPLVRVYGPQTAAARGGIVAFNVLDREGGPLPHSVVEERARERGVAVRGGCFCNPGASEAAFGVDPERASACLAQLGDSFTEGALARCLGVPLGAVRVSVGLANDANDVRRAIEVVTSFLA